MLTEIGEFGVRAWFAGVSSEDRRRLLICRVCGTWAEVALPEAKRRARRSLPERQLDAGVEKMDGPEPGEEVARVPGQRTGAALVPGDTEATADVRRDELPGAAGVVAVALESSPEGALRGGGPDVAVPGPQFGKCLVGALSRDAGPEAKTLFDEGTGAADVPTVAVQLSSPGEALALLDAAPDVVAPRRTAWERLWGPWTVD